MTEQQVLLDRRAWQRFKKHVHILTHSEVGGRALGLFALLIALAIGINGINVVNSYVARDFMTAIVQKDRAGFIRYALVWLGVFAGATLVTVVSRFIEERLGLLWRRFLTDRGMRLYTSHRIYLHLGESEEIGNPDQRITDDVKFFATTTLSFVLMLINSTLTIIAFSGVLWSISPLLLGVAVLYAGLGSLLTIWLGRPLIRLNFDQLDKEANFRAELIQFRENAHAIAFSRRESTLARRMLHRLDDLVENLVKLIAVNRNIGFFTTFYNWVIQILPALFVAPLFIAGNVEFGVITQSAMAFTTLVSAFSLVVTQFQSISSFAAVLARLSSFGEVMEEEIIRRVDPIAVETAPNRIAYVGLTLRSPHSGRSLVEALDASLSRSQRLLVSSPDAAACAALFGATAGLWTAGEGRIVRPELDELAFIAERPFLPPGTLRDVMHPSEPLETQEDATTYLRLPPLRPPRQLPDEDLLRALASAGLESLPTRCGGWDHAVDWSRILSLGEQQLLVFARALLARPRFAFLDRPSTALTGNQLDRLLEEFRQRTIGYVVLAADDDRLDRYDARLELSGDGEWQWRPLGTTGA